MRPTPVGFQKLGPDFLASSGEWPLGLRPADRANNQNPRGLPSPRDHSRELHHAESTSSCRNRIFRVLRYLGSTTGSRPHINSGRNLRSRSEKNAVRHSYPKAEVTVRKAYDKRLLIESHIVSVIPVNNPSAS